MIQQLNIYTTVRNLSLCMFLLTSACKPYYYQGQRFTNTERVDSLFRKNFQELDTVVFLNKKTSLSVENIRFVYLISFLSGINFNVESSYTGTPVLTPQLLTEWERWYNMNKSKIDWQRHIIRGFQLMTEIIDPAFSEAELNNKTEELKKLKII